jgi:hypothetical protein
MLLSWWLPEGVGSKHRCDDAHTPHGEASGVLRPHVIKPLDHQHLVGIELAKAFRFAESQPMQKSPRGCVWLLECKRRRP